MINKDDIITMSAFDLLFKISWYDKEKRLELYRDENIVKKLQTYLKESEKNRWHYFRKLVEMIDMNEIFVIFPDNVLIDYINNNKEHGYIFFGALFEKSPKEALQILLHHDDLFKYFVKYMYEVSSLMSGLTYEDAEHLMTKIHDLELDEEKNVYRFINILSQEDQNKLIQNIGDEKTLTKIVKNSSRDTKKGFFLNDKRATFIYKNFDIVELSKEGIKFSKEILSDPAYFDKIKCLNITNMRTNLNIVEQTNPSNKLRENLVKYYDEIVSGYDSENEMLNILKPQFSTYGEFAKKQTSDMLSQLVVDGLFEDNLNNVKLNIEEIIKYNEKLEQSMLDDTMLEIYKMILNIEKWSNEEKIEFYNKYKNKSIHTIFYMHLRKLKDLSYNEINNALFKTNERSDCLVKSIKENNQIEVYDLWDKEYTMLVRCLETPFREETFHNRDCYTLISNENNIVFKEDSYIYGYAYFDIPRICHVNESDVYSTDHYDNEQTTNRVNRIMKSEDIINNFSGIARYSEIQINNQKVGNQYKALTPSYIICYDNITKKVLEESKRLHIPICIIKKKMLEKSPEEGIKCGKYIV